VVCSPWRARQVSCHHHARRSEWLCSPWRANHAPCDTLLAVASSFARRGGQTWLFVTMLLASHASLLTVASTDSWLSRISHFSSQNPNFEPLHPKFGFQSLPKHFQTLKELQNHMKFEPKQFPIQKPHLTHFCKPHMNTPIFLTTLNDHDLPRFNSTMITSHNSNNNNNHF